MPLHKYKLIAIQDTLVKVTPDQSQQIRDEGWVHGLVPVRAGGIIECESLNFIEGTGNLSEEVDSDDYYFFRSIEPLGDTQRRAMFAFAPHFTVEEGEHADPTDEPLIISAAQKQQAAKIVKSTPNNLLLQDDEAIEKDLGPLIVIPGFTDPKRLLAPIYDKSGNQTNFTWAEATKGGTRIPVNAKITQGIIGIAADMQLIRSIIGAPLFITSWYRDPKTNERVGGASRSRHLSGDAVDFYCKTVSAVDIFYTLKGHPILSGGGLAVGGRGAKGTFVHKDRRTGKSRWVYRNGPKVDIW